MMEYKIREVLDRVIVEMDPDELNFLSIQNALFSDLTTSWNPQEAAELLRGEVLYKVLEEMNDPRIRLYGHQLENKTKSLSRREIEALGICLETLSNFRPEFYLSENSCAKMLCHAQRGYVYIVQIGDKQYVVKPFQSSQEQVIAPLADRIGAGPHIFDTSEGWLAEELLDKASLWKTMDEIAAELGRIYGSLHRAGIIYNDDPARHFYRRENSGVLIDYGVAMLSNDTERDFELLDRNTAIYGYGWKRSEVFRKSYERSLSIQIDGKTA